MNSSIKHIIRSLITVIKTFMDKGQSAGLLLIGSTIFSLVMANIPGIGGKYTALWHTRLFNQPPSVFPLPQSPLHIINDCMMAFFFLLVAMEIKREIMEGELASLRKSLLPVFAALGGMVCPAVIFGLFNSNTVFSHGWGIPMATDIAFSLGILSLLGDKVPFQLKIFLMALAVMDDMGGILTIALFYAEQIHYFYLIPVGILLLLLTTMNRRGINKIGYFLLPGLLLWYCIYRSGIHGTIAGALFAFCLPKNLELELGLARPVGFIVMPLFALANMAISLNGSVDTSLSSTLSLGIIAGLMLGKPLGIFLFSFLAHKTHIASLPSGTSYKELFGVGMLGGIGFTMSIFTATLAYPLIDYQTTAKIAIMTGSVLSALAGLYFLKRIFSGRSAAAAHKEMEKQKRVQQEPIGSLPEIA